MLMYYRMYTSYALVGYLFGLDVSNVCRDIEYMEPAVKSCIPIPARKYADAKKATTLEELEQYFPELKVIIDASEEIPRPKEKDALFGKEKTTHCQEPVCCKPQRRDNSPASTLTWQASRLLYIEEKASCIARRSGNIC